MGGDHFIIYYPQDESFAKKVLKNAEIYYRKIAIDIGYPRYSEFWTWDKRVKIYIYPDHASFLKASGQPQWSHGMADYNKKQILSYMWAGTFIDSILPHEIAHLIFRDFVGFTGKIPLWLDEGVAQWAEVKKRKEMKATAIAYYEKDNLLLLNDLVNLDIQSYKDMNIVHVRPTITKKGDPATLLADTNSLVSIYYLVAVSLIDFLIEKYGSGRFAQFCRELRDGKSIDDALRFAYPSNITSLDDLDKKWRAYLGKMADSAHNRR